MKPQTVAVTAQETRRFVEQLLRDYRVNKSLLQRYQAADGALRRSLAASLPLVAGAPGLTASPAAEADFAARMARLAWYVAAIDDLWDAASAEERLLLEERYFSSRPKQVWQVANLMCVSRSQLYRHRDHLLDWLAKRLGLMADAACRAAPGQQRQAGH